MITNAKPVLTIEVARVGLYLIFGATKDLATSDAFPEIVELENVNGDASYFDQDGENGDDG